MFYFVAFLLISAVASAFRPPTQQRDPATLDDLNPTTREGNTIGVVFGTRDVTDYNMAWMGDLSTVEINTGGGGKK